MKNMKVKQKLLISFLVIAIITAIVGSVGIAGLIQLNHNEHTIYELGIKISDVNRLRENIQKQRSAYRDVVLYANNEEKRVSAVVLSEELEQEFRGMHAYLVEHLATETSHNLLRDIMDIYENKFDPIKQQVMQPEVAQDEELHYHLMEMLAVELNALLEKMDALIEYAMAYTENVSVTDEKTANRIIFAVAVLAVVSVAGAILMGLYLSQHITVPLLKMKSVMDRVGNTGCLEFSDEEMNGLVEESKGQDEICQSIASSVKMIRNLMNASAAMRQVTKGDLTAEITPLSEQDTIGVVVNQMLEQLNTMLSEVHRSSAQVSAGSGQVSHGAQELASGSSQQAASIEEFTATLQELRSKTDHNAENATQAREANGRASARLEGSIHSMRELLVAMKAIDESSSNITKVIKVIDDIAFQTNILALNAAVEAARAGQHGKGFAVVADEVRNLAAKSAEAAKETAELIEGSSARVKEGNQIVERTNSDLEAAVKNSREITRLIEQVAAESNDQATALAEINQGIEQISSVVQSNSATSEQSAAASEQMSAQAATLEEIVSRFKLREQTAAGTGYPVPEDNSFRDYASSDTGFALSWKQRTSA